jgi:hypothetical protein
MTQFKAFSILFLTFIATTSFAQTTKGNYSVNGNVGLTADLVKNGSYQHLQTSALINPSVGKFITDKWFVGVQPNLFAYSTTIGWRKPNALKNYVSGQKLGLGITARYYFTDDVNTRFFGLMAVETSEIGSFFKVSATRLNGKERKSVIR